MTIRDALNQAAERGAECATWEVRNAALAALDALDVDDSPEMVSEIGVAFGILSGARWSPTETGLIVAVMDAANASGVMV